MSADMSSRKRKHISFAEIEQVMVTVKVGPQAQPYIIHRDLLCHYSGYFRGCFKGNFSESSSRESFRPETSVRTFTVFVDWLYTQTLSLPALPYYEYLEQMRQQDSMYTDDVDSPLSDAGDVESLCTTLSDLPVEGRKPEPGEWSSAELIDLYAFADQHEVVQLRNDVMTLWQEQEDLLETFPTAYIINRAFASLSSRSTLCQYLLEVFCFFWNPEDDTLEDVQERKDWPAEFLLELLIRTTTRLRASERYDFQPKELPNFCKFHEHESEEEAEQCRIGWEQRKRVRKQLKRDVVKRQKKG